ncbi:hypothetical protein ABXZ28_13035, partial [Streptococcus suis]
PLFNFHISSRKALQLARKHADAFFFVVFFNSKSVCGEQRFETLSNKSFWLKFLIFFGYLFHDIFSRIKNGQDFREY